VRRLVTFILRLWVNSEDGLATYEGQVECVATGERMHIRTQEEVIHFIETRVGLPAGVEAQAGKQTDQ
jgi:hypothetical protein